MKKTRLHKSSKNPLPVLKKKLEIDHIIPFAKGGLNELDNMWLLCVECHDKKDNKLGEEGSREAGVRGSPKDYVIRMNRLEKYYTN